MKSTGIVRQLDSLGRVVLPIELRRQYGIGDRGFVEVYTDKDSIVLKKVQSSCVFCEGTNNLTTYMGKCICADCIGKLK